MFKKREAYEMMNTNSQQTYPYIYNVWSNKSSLPCLVPDSYKIVQSYLFNEIILSKVACLLFSFISLQVLTEYALFLANSVWQIFSHT